MIARNIQLIERNLLLEAIYHRYGYDFREYEESSLNRRLAVAMEKEGIKHVSQFQDRILRDDECMSRFMDTMSINLTAMYRDPEFYLALRRRVMPILETYPYIRLWIAGCSTGEELLSLAILLEEEGLYHRCRIYATDMSDAALQKAKRCIYPLKNVQDFSDNYLKAGGRKQLRDYYTADSSHVIFRNSLMANVTLAQHNLVSDASFNEFHVILCRNVMIYFSMNLQNRVIQLFNDSLIRFGFLGLGMNETLSYSRFENQYTEIEAHTRLYRRKI